MLYICDQKNHRIVKRDLDLSYDSKIGSQGSGNDQFNNPGDITTDGIYLYICDTWNNRIVKRLSSNLSYVSKIESIADKYYITTDGVHIYSTEFNKIIKRLCSDLSYVSEIGGSAGSGDDQFNSISGITTDGIYLYVSDGNNARIVKRLCSDLSYVSQIGTAGSGDDQFQDPGPITTDSIYLYLWDYSNYRVMKRLNSDLSYIDKLILDDTIWMQSYTTDGVYLYIMEYMSDPPTTHKLLKHTIGLSPISSIGGSSGTGNDQFNKPFGITSDEWFSLLLTPSPEVYDYATQMQINTSNQAQFLTKCGGNSNIKEKLIHTVTLVEQEKMYNPIVDNMIVVTPNVNNVIETFSASPLPARSINTTTQNSSGGGNNTGGVESPPLTEGEFRALIRNLYGDFTGTEAHEGYG